VWPSQLYVNLLLLGKLLEALRGDGGEVPAELGVLRQNHRATRDEAVDQRLLPHLGFACSATDGLVIAHFSAASLSLDLARAKQQRSEQ